MRALTRNQMHTGIDLGLQQLSSNTFLKLQAESKDYFLNKMINEFVKETIDDVSKENKQNGVVLSDITAIRSKFNRLSTLIKSAPGTIDANSYFVTTVGTLNIPSDYYSTLGMKFTLTHGTYGTINVAGVQFELGENYSLELDPYTAGKANIPYSLYRSAFTSPPTYSATDHKVRIHVPTAIRTLITAAELYYVASPAIISATQDCDLRAAYHDDIVDRTVKFIAANISNPNYQYLLSEQK